MRNWVRIHKKLILGLFIAAATFGLSWPLPAELVGYLQWRRLGFDRGKVYQNMRYAYQFSYPDVVGWEVESLGKEDKDSLGSDFIRLKGSVDDSASEIFLEIFVTTNTEKVTDSQILDYIEGLMGAYDEKLFFKEREMGNFRAIEATGKDGSYNLLVLRDDKVYLLTSPKRSDAASLLEKKLVDQIIESFSFFSSLEFKRPEQWSDYRNSDFGFEFTYPTEVKIKTFDGDDFIRKDLGSIDRSFVSTQKAEPPKLLFSLEVEDPGGGLYFPEKELSVHVLDNPGHLSISDWYNIYFYYPQNFWTGPDEAKQNSRPIFETNVGGVKGLSNVLSNTFKYVYIERNEKMYLFVLRSEDYLDLGEMILSSVHFIN